VSKKKAGGFPAFPYGINHGAQFPTCRFHSVHRFRTAQLARGPRPDRCCHLSPPVGGWDPGPRTDPQRRAGARAAIALGEGERVDWLLSPAHMAGEPRGRRHRRGPCARAGTHGPQARAAPPGPESSRRPACLPAHERQSRPLPRCPVPWPTSTLTSSSSSSPSQRSPPAVPPPPTFRTGSSTENVSASTEESELR
jgi:hypothetical protein